LFFFVFFCFFFVAFSLTTAEFFRFFCDESLGIKKNNPSVSLFVGGQIEAWNRRKDLFFLSKFSS